jgi:signal transduction histidine kinase
MAALAVAVGVGLAAFDSWRAGRARDALGLTRLVSALDTDADLERVVSEGGLHGALALDASGAAVRVGGASQGLEALARPCLERPVPAVPRFVGPLELDGLQLVGACRPIGGGAVAVAELDPERGGALRRRTLALGFVIGTLAASLVVASVRSLVAPFSQMSEAAGRLARGERGVRLAAPDEPDLRPLVEALNQLAAALEEREDAVVGRLELTRQIAALVAHEVRNPLHSLTLLADVACHEEDPEERLVALRAIQRELGLIEEVVRRLVDSGEELHLVRREVDLAQLVARAFQLQTPRATALGVTLRRAGADAAPAQLDAALVRCALENLVHNAVELRGEAGGGVVEVRIEPDGERWVVYVDDDGAGVEERDRERIFEPGVSFRGGGTGLGLHLARKVARAHGGDLTCAGSPLGGARFTLVLPRE